MKLSRFMAKQLANPSGLFGRIVMTRLLNRINRLENQTVYKALEIEQGNKVLDIGFGGGELLLHVARNSACSEVCGVERSQEMIQRLDNIIRNDRKLKSVKTALGDISALPVSDQEYDRVCTVNTIYFWSNLNQGCHELARVTASNGKIVLGYGSGEKLSESGYADNGFVFYPPNTIHKAMENAGLQLEKQNQLDRKDKDPFYISVYHKSE